MAVQLQYSFNYGILVSQLTGLPQWDPSLLPPSVPSLPTLPVEVGGTALVPTPPATVPAAAVTASYLTVNPESGLPNARQLKAGANVTLIDNGPGSNLQVVSSGGGGGGGGATFVPITSTPYPLQQATGSGVQLALKNQTGQVLTINAHAGDTIDGASSLIVAGLGAATVVDQAAGKWAII